MFVRRLWVVSLLILSLSFAIHAKTDGEASIKAKPALRSSQFQFPLMFEENVGQSQSGQYVSHGPGYDMQFEGEHFNLIVRDANKTRTLQVGFPGSNHQAKFAAAEPLATRTNYFIGSDPSLWRTGVANFSRLALDEIYPGTNLVFYGKGGQMEHDFVVAPFADPSRIGLQVSGADKLSIAENGDLLIATPAGEFRFRKPYAYQKVNGLNRSVEAAFVLKRHGVAGFSLGEYDHRYPLTIDPVLIFATYLTGANGSMGTAVAVDHNNITYVTGTTSSLNFGNPPALTPTPPNQGNSDIFIAKLNGDSVPADDGTKLAWLTFFGGSGNETAQALVLDGPTPAEVYISGTTDTPDKTFPTTTNAYQPKSANGSKLGGCVATPPVNCTAFVARFSSDKGALDYSTFLGGTGNQSARGLGFSGGLLYVAGDTDTGDIIPTTPAPLSFQPTFSSAPGERSGFALIINPNPTTPSSQPLQYGTYLHGNKQNDVVSVAALALSVTSQNAPAQIFLTGNVLTTLNPTNIAQNKADFPSVTNQVSSQPSFQPAVGDTANAFVVQINPANGGNNDLIFATLTTGNHDDRGTSIVVDSSGIVIGGTTTSKTSLSVGTVLEVNRPSNNAINHGFIATLNSAGMITAATYFGGGNVDKINALATDNSQRIVVAGETTSTDIPQTSNNTTVSTTTGFPPNNGNGSNNGFISRIARNLSTVDYFTFLDGSTGNDQLQGLALDPSGNAVVIGTFNSTDGPATASSFQSVTPSLVAGNLGAAFVAKFASIPTSAVQLKLTLDKTTAVACSPLTTCQDFATVMTNSWTIDNPSSTNSASATSVVFNNPLPNNGGPDLNFNTYVTLLSPPDAGTCTFNQGGVTCLIPKIDLDSPVKVTVSATVLPAVNNIIDANGNVCHVRDDPNAHQCTLTVNATVDNAEQETTQSTPASAAVLPVRPITVTIQSSASNAASPVKVCAAPCSSPNANQMLTYTLSAISSAQGISPENVAIDIHADPNFNFLKFSDNSPNSDVICVPGASSTTETVVHCVIDSVTVAKSINSITVTGTVGTGAIAGSAPGTITAFATWSGPNTPAGSTLTPPPPAPPVPPVVSFVQRSSSILVTLGQNLLPGGNAIKGPIALSNAQHVGDTVQYQVTLANSGPSDANGVCIDVTPPPDFSTQNLTTAPQLSPSAPPAAAGSCGANSPAQNTCGLVNGHIQCSVGTIFAPTSQNPTPNPTALTYAGTFSPQAALSNGTKTETSSVNISVAPPVVIGPSASAPAILVLSGGKSESLTIQRQVQLSASETFKPANTTLQPGLTTVNLDEGASSTTGNDVANYSATLSNQGLNDASNVSITETLPPFFVVNGAPVISGAGNSCSNPISNNNQPSKTGNQFTCTIGTLSSTSVATGAQAPVPITITFSGKFAGGGQNGVPFNDLGASGPTPGQQVETTNLSITAPDSVDPTVANATSNTKLDSAGITVVRRAALTASANSTSVPNPPATGATPTVNLGNSANVNDTVSYSVTFTNNGVNDAVGLSLSDVLPPFFFVLQSPIITSTDARNSGLNATCTGAPTVPPSIANPTFTCQFPSTFVLAAKAGSTITVAFTGKFADNGAAADVLAPSLSITATGVSHALTPTGHIFPGGDPAVTSPAVNVQRSADIGIAFSPQISQVGAGDKVTYVATITNQGPNIATNVALSMQAPTGLVLSGAAVASQPATCDPNGGGCTSIPVIVPGAPFTYTLNGTFALGLDKATGNVSNFESHAISAVSVSGTGIVDPTTPDTAAASTVNVVNTHQGSNIQVTPDAPLLPNNQAPLSVTFSSINSIGVTSMTTGPISAAPAGYRAGQSGKELHFDVTTSAANTNAPPSATVCVNVPDTLGFIKPNRARLFLLNSASGPIDITSSILPAPGATEQLPVAFDSVTEASKPFLLAQVCGVVPAFTTNAVFSFGVFEPANHAPIYGSDAANTNNKPTISVTPVSGKGTTSDSLNITLQKEADADSNACLLGPGQTQATCNDRPQVRTFLFFAARFLAGSGNCNSPNGCSVIEITSKSDPTVSVNMPSGRQPLCIATADQTFNLNQTDVPAVCGFLTQSFNGANGCVANTQAPDGLNVEICPVDVPGNVVSGSGSTSNSATVSAGQSATTSIVLFGAPTDGSTAPSLTCAAAPGTPDLAASQISCSLPATAPNNTLDGQAILPLSLITTGPTFARLTPQPPSRNPSLPFYGFAAAPFAAVLLLSGLNRKKPGLKWRGLTLAVTGLLVLAALQLGCGGGHIGSGSPQSQTSGTPAGVYKILVTSSNNNVVFDPGDGTAITKTYTFTLTVVR